MRNLVYVLYNFRTVIHPSPYSTWRRTYMHGLTASHREHPAEDYSAGVSHFLLTVLFILHQLRH
jgi:hypothetical protein